MEGRRRERLHLQGTLGVSCSSLDARTTTSRDIVKMERTMSRVWKVCHEVFLS